MDCKCPNCQGTAQRHKLKDGADLIECPTCGAFDLQPDGTWTASQQEPSLRSAGGRASAATDGGGAGLSQPAPPETEPSRSASQQTPDAGGGASPPAKPVTSDQDETLNIEIGLADDDETE